MYIFAAKNGAPVANLAKIVFADGKELGTQLPGLPGRRHRHRRRRQRPHGKRRKKGGLIMRNRLVASATS